jgi:hypothetical protein
MVKPAERVSFAVVARGLSGRLPLEVVRRSAAFEELLEVENPFPVEVDLGQFVSGQQGVESEVEFPVVSGPPVPQGGLGGFRVERPSGVEERVASERAARLGRSGPSVEDWVVAGSGRG